MAKYTKVFDNPYPNGWEDLPSENTPITASALQEHTDAIENIEQYLEDNPIEKGGTDVEWNQIVKSGTKIAEVTIEEEKIDVYAPKSEGGASTWSEVAEKPFETIGSGLKVENNVLKSTDLSGTKAEFDAIKDSLPDGSAFDTTDEEVGGELIIPIFDFTIDGLSFSECEYINGGYFKLGNIVFVNLRVSITTIFSPESSVNIDNMPPVDTRYAFWDFTVVNTNTERRRQNTYGFMNNSNRLIGRLSNAVIGDVINISGWYLTIDKKGR